MLSFVSLNVAWPVSVTLSCVRLVSVITATRLAGRFVTATLLESATKFSPSAPANSPLVSVISSGTVLSM
jgi:hypothetical protein